MRRSPIPLDRFIFWTEAWSTLSMTAFSNSCFEELPPVNFASMSPKNMFLAPTVLFLLSEQPIAYPCAHDQGGEQQHVQQGIQGDVAEGHCHERPAHFRCLHQAIARVGVVKQDHACGPIQHKMLGLAVLRGDEPTTSM